MEPLDAPWAHDMHEVISRPSGKYGQSNYAERAPPTARSSTPPNRSFSTTKHIGNVQIRISFASMPKPVIFTGIPVKQYTRLPDHRPPLRRDKPVRISLPSHPPRYIFPAVERSFIFIPRALRPNQQGYGGRARGRNGLGSVGGYSRRTSVFGGSIYGSVYSPSVAMSRRSSLARETNREFLASPAGSTISRPPMVHDLSRPVVKLPPAMPPAQIPQLQIMEDFSAANVEAMSRPAAYPMPQQPTFRENRSNAIPMHQPRPQKAVSVADIESPATLAFNPPQQQQQPFHQQVPIQVNGDTHNSEAATHARHASHQGQTAGTPLSQIPERAIHAQPFQPAPFQQQNFYGAPYQHGMPSTQQGVFYPGAPYHNSTHGHNSYMSTQPPAAGFPPQQAQSTPTSANGLQNLIAQEANGMVYYYDANQVASYQAYQQPTTFPMPGGVVGMGGMMTPSPDGFYYPQPPSGVMYFSQ